MKRFALLLGLAALLIAGCGGSDQSGSDTDVVLSEEQAQLVNTYAEEMDQGRAKVDEVLSAIEQGDGTAALEACTATMESVGAAMRTVTELFEADLPAEQGEALKEPTAYLHATCISLINHINRGIKDNSLGDDPVEQAAMNHLAEFDEMMESPDIQKVLAAA